MSKRGKTPVAKLDPDNRIVVALVTVLVGALGITALIASFSGLIGVASWAHLPASIRWTTPTMLDGAILVYTAAALVRRARGESTRLAWTGVIVGTSLSAAANAAHVILSGAPVDGPGIRAAGAFVAALAPVLAALAVHQVADLAVATPEDEVRAPRARRSVAVHVTTTPAPVLPATAPTPVASVPVVTSRAVTDRPAPAPRAAGRAGLSPAQIAELAAPLRAQGLSYEAIGKELGGVTKYRVMRALAQVSASEQADSIGAAA